MKDNVKVAAELVKIAKSLTANELPHIVDQFTRYLIGDKKQALNRLSTTSFKPSVEIGEGAEYNKLYDALFASIYEAVKKHIS